LVEVFQRLLGLSKLSINVGNYEKSVGFAGFVSDFPPERERLFKKLQAFVEFSRE
jgi:hypothetical protein